MKEKAVGDFYDQLWKNFKIVPSEMTTQLLTAISEKPSWFRNKVCLDAGCGHGGYLKTLVELPTRRVYGLDIVMRSASLLKRRLPACEKKKLVIKKGSILQLPFKDRYFDLVICQGVLHHTVNPQLGFQELARVLKPGGYLYLAVYGRGGVLNYLNNFARLVLKPIPTNYLSKVFAWWLKPNQVVKLVDSLKVPVVNFYNEKEIRRWFKKYHFNNIRRTAANWEKRLQHSAFRNWLYGDNWIQIIGKK